MDQSFPLRSAFLALPLVGKTKRQFRALQDELKPYADFLSFQNPQSPHLTLYFWEELLKIEHDQMVLQVEKISVRSSPFILRINGFNTFGKTGEEKILFLTVAFSPELAALKKLCPWPNPPHQPFHPHITLARINHAKRFGVQRKKIEKVLDGISMDVPVTMIRFYADINGHKQTPILDFPFGK